MLYRVISFVLLSIFSFTASLYAATGAGVLPLFDDGTVLVGKEIRHSPTRGSYTVWSDFGGGQDPKDKGSLVATALREFKEETGHYSFPHITWNEVQIAPVAVHNHPQTGQSYEMRFLPIHGPKPTIQDIHKNAAHAKKKLGSKAHVEKIDWKYVDAGQLVNAVYANANLPGTNEEIFGPFKACIKKPTAQATLQALINGPKQPTVYQQSSSGGKKAAPVKGKKSSKETKKSSKKTNKSSKKAAKKTSKATKKAAKKTSKATKKLRRK